MNLSQMPQKPTLALIKENFEGKLVQDSRSPAGNWLEFTLDKIEKGRVEISLNVKPEMTNPFGNIHGGMMALVMDEVIGWAVLSLEAEQYYTSLNLNVDFLYAVSGGDRIKAIATIIRHGKKIVHAECEVRHAVNDTLLGKGSSNLIATGLGHR